jgi:hypothetical protein
MAIDDYYAEDTDEQDTLNAQIDGLTMIELALTPEQAEALSRIVHPRAPVLFVATAAPHWNDKESIWRLQAESLDHKQARKVLKIINDDKK